MTKFEAAQLERAGQRPHPLQLEVLEFGAYSLVIDARSPREYAEDHIPGAVNLPVVYDEEFAEVGTRHVTDPHSAYLIGVQYSLHNIAEHMKSLITRFGPTDRMLVYCFRGGKRSKLWADNLRTIGYEVDVLRGGWKNYRRWVIASLKTLPHSFEYRVLSGSTGAGKTRLLGALSEVGEQVLDLEDMANHRGSLIGEVPGLAQPSQKTFDTLLLDAMRRLDPDRPVWIEAESKKIGNVQLPDALFEAMHLASPIRIEAPMQERVRLWREDYAHLAANPVAMVEQLEPLKPLVGGKELATWHELAAAGNVDALFARVMVHHYDPCYARSTKRSYRSGEGETIALPSLGHDRLLEAARDLATRYGRL